MRRNSKPLLVFSLLLAAGITASAQFKPVGPAPYAATVARQKIHALMGKMDASNRQQSIATISGLLNWYRDIVDDELTAAWMKDDGRENLPQVMTALADARVASVVVEFSWRQRRQATFQPSAAPMFGNLMLRFQESAKPFLDDLLASPVPELTEPEAFTVCRILLDMPDVEGWRKNAAQILPHYREAAETLLAADLNQGDPEKKYRAQYWINALRPSETAGFSSRGAVASAAPPESGAASGTLECTGDPIAPNAEYVFHNVPTANRRFEFDRKVWDVRLTPGQGATKDMTLTNKSSRPQKRCTVRWTVIP